MTNISIMSAHERLFETAQQLTNKTETRTGCSSQRVTGLVPSAVGARAAAVALRRAAVERAGGHPVHHRLADAWRAVRRDDQRLLRSFPRDVIARGIRKLVERQLLADNVLCQEGFEPLAGSWCPFVASCVCQVKVLPCLHWEGEVQRKTRGVGGDGVFISLLT